MKRLPIPRHALLTFAFSLAALGLAVPASGQTTTWTGAVSGDWTDAGNWSNGVPTGPNQAIFNGAGTGASLINVNSTNFAGSTFNSGAYATTGSFSNTVAISGGSLTYSNGVVFPGGSVTVAVAAGAALNFTAINKWGGATFTGGGDYRVGNISYQSGSLSKTGTGTLTLNGSSYAYGGSTSVTAGTLLVTGTLTASSTAAVNVTGATIGGTGTIARPTTVNTGATLAPGVTVGILTFGGALTLAGGANPVSWATTAFELNGTTRGTGYDGINLTSTTSLLTYGGLLSLNFGTTFLNGTDLNLFDLATTGVGAVPAGSFNMITGAGNYAGNFTNTGGIWTMESGGQLLTFTQSTGNLTFSAALTAVPEPTTYALLAGAMGLAVAAWRRGGKRESVG